MLDGEGLITASEEGSAGAWSCSKKPVTAVNLNLGVSAAIVFDFRVSDLNGGYKVQTIK